MSLKAKLEAVIYAAEEPVTLAQLALLFTEDALAWKAEREAAAAEPDQPTEPVGALPFLEEVPARTDSQDFALASVSSEPREQSASAESETENGIHGESEPGVDESASGDIPKAPPVPEETAPVADPETNARREALARDREVRAILRRLLDELIQTYSSDSRGIEIREIAGGYRMATKPSCHDAVRSFVKFLKPPFKLSIPALETLAVIAYKQPVTGPEVNEIRGVDSSGVFGSLLARKLIATAGRKQVVGRPILYKTTKEFLLRFGLKDIAELPSMEEFEKMAVELEAAEGVETEITGEEPPSPEESAPVIAEDLDLELSQAGDEETAAVSVSDAATQDPVHASTTFEAR